MYFVLTSISVTQEVVFPHSMLLATFLLSEIISNAFSTQCASFHYCFVKSTFLTGIQTTLRREKLPGRNQGPQQAAGVGGKQNALWSPLPLLRCHRIQASPALPKSPGLELGFTA